MRGLSLMADNKAKKDLIETRREQFEKDCEECKEDFEKQMDLWYNYIEWLEQNMPEGGKISGLTTAIEQCIEIFYNRNEFKQDERLFEVFLKFKRFCDEPTEIFTFMYANSIGTLLARFYLNWSWQYEIKKNMKRAQDLLKLGLKNLASPRDVLQEALCQVEFRFQRMIRDGELDDVSDSSSAGGASHRELQAELANNGIRAALQTLKCKKSKARGLSVPVSRIGIAVDCANVGGLKSQTQVVNGIRVPKKVAPGGGRLKPRSNAPVAIFDPISENGNENAAAGISGGGNENITDENARPPMSMIKRMGTAQPIRLVGRTGAENFAPIRGVISAKHKPAVLLD